MEKLPHERLREAEGFGDICYYFDYDGDEEYEAYSKIADEIERYYIPRPRFEDGEPVQFGDEFIIDRYMIEPETLKHLGIFSKELLDEWEQYYGVAPVYEMNFNRPNCKDGKIPIVKRTTKVLDADNLEKVMQFAKEWSHTDNVSNSSANDFRDAMQEVADRLTAIMERDYQ